MTIEVSTRGSRRSHTMASVAGDQVTPMSSPSVRQRMTPSVSAGPIRTDPSPTPSTRIADRCKPGSQTDGERPRPDPGGDAARTEVAGDRSTDIV